MPEGFHNHDHLRGGHFNSYDPWRHEEGIIYDQDEITAKDAVFEEMGITDAEIKKVEKCIATKSYHELVYYIEEYLPVERQDAARAAVDALLAADGIVLE